MRRIQRHCASRPRTVELRNCSGHETISDGRRRKRPACKYVRRILEAQRVTKLCWRRRTATRRWRRRASTGGPIHLLLTDIVMPEMGGVDLVGEFGFAAAPRSRTVHVRVFGTVVAQGDLTSYLQKPFTPVMLLTQSPIALGPRANGA